MEHIHDYEDICARYLLGELSEPEQAQFEDSYFADDLLFERFLAVKEDLIDAYARGDLGGPKRERFERHFLSSEPRRQRVEEARVFIRALTAASTDAATVNRTRALAPATPTSGWRSIPKLFASLPLAWQGALVALLVVAVAGSLLLVRQFQSRLAERERLQNEVATRKQEEERRPAVAPPVNSNALPANPHPSPAPEETPKPAEKPIRQVASLYLTAFSARDATPSNSLTLRPDTMAVRLRLSFKGEGYARYDVTLRTLDGKQLLSRRGLKAGSSASGKSVTLTLNPAILQQQDYIVTVSGLTDDGRVEAINDYYFHVERGAPQATPTPKLR